MTPEEEIITAFLSVWENQPDLFNDPLVSSNHLARLQTDLIEKQASNEDVAEILDTWLGNYETITTAVEQAISAARKVDAEANIPPKPDPANQIIINQYPKISQILRNRPPKTTEKNKQ